VFGRPWRGRATDTARQALLNECGSARRCLNPEVALEMYAPSRVLVGRAFAQGPRPADQHPWLMRSEVVIASLFSEAQLLVERIVGDDLG
jgi:hypothetical protein